MVWNVPLFDIDLADEEIRAVEEVLRSKWISLGEVTTSFEGLFSQGVKARYALAVSSGTAALHLALRALGIKQGDEVIVPSLTFVATANAIRYVGAKVVFADIESLSYPNISIQEIESKISHRTKAIIVVHYAGYPCRMEEIIPIARRYNLRIVEDSAHAMKAVYRDKHLGTWGDIGCFSFFSNKNMTTAEGGMVVTNHESIYQKVKLMRSHGMTTISFDRFKGHASSYDVVELGYNYRIDDIRSAIGIIQLSRLIENQKKRQQLTEIYRKLLLGISEVSVPFRLEQQSAFHIQPIIVKKAQRDLIREYMHQHGIQTSIHYPPVHRFNIYKRAKADLPKTEEYAEREITLPLYPNMDEEKVYLIVNRLKEAISYAQ